MNILAMRFTFITLDVPYPKKGTGNWTSGYVRQKGTNDLIVFMNIDVAGTTGHDFPNKYDPVNNTITWYGKPKTNSKQKTFKMIKDGTLSSHFFARWDTSKPFKYLGVGTDFNFEDGHPTKTRNGKITTCVQVTLRVEDAKKVIEATRHASSKIDIAFRMEKYLEEFIVDNWNQLDLSVDYDRCEEEVDGKRKKFRTDTGEIDIFAMSKDKSKFLVIELKRGRATDRVVGQIQSYMDYIKDELATKGQEVKGLIIGLDDDQRMKRALSINPQIEFRKYKIKFELVKSAQ